MELKAFVTAVLTEIIDGVKDAQRVVRSMRGKARQILYYRLANTFCKLKGGWYLAGGSWCSL